MNNVNVLCCLLLIAAVFGEDHVAYKFEYGVNDPHTKDHKSHSEHREGDHVVGTYTLQEPDGTHRIVKYKSGPHSGFEAVVERVGHTQHPDGHHSHHQGGSSHVGTTHWGNQGHEGTGH